MLNTILFLQAVLPFTMGTDWSIHIPSQLTTLARDCVVIPCKYVLSKVYEPSRINVMWYQEKEDGTQEIIFHNHEHYWSRASFVGNWQNGDCSLWIRDVKREDTRSYGFLMEIKDLRNYSSPSPVHLHVEDVPFRPDLQISAKKIIEGDEITLTCRINHTCDIRFPSLEWNHEFGDILNSKLYIGNGIWQLVSNLTFTASSKHQGLTFSCQAKYAKLETRPQSMPYLLNVLYSPKNTTIEVSVGEIKEGQNVSLSCISQSNPEVTQYAWYGVTDRGVILPLPENQSKILIMDLQLSLRSFYCTAQNELGIQTSPVLRINMTYKPQIRPESHCRPKFSNMVCSCVVDSNPPAIITWRLVNRNISETGEGFDVSSPSSDYVTQSLLKGEASSMANVSCYAENEKGTSELVLPIYLDIGKCLLITGVCGAVLLLVIAVAVKIMSNHRINTAAKKNSMHCYIPNNLYISKAVSHESVYANVARKPKLEEVTTDTKCETDLEDYSAAYDLPDPEYDNYSIYQNT